ncbi:MAG: 3-phosphoshikimate 1-carboxyvinyltransferase [Cyanobacteria bacterium P01_H01_bin.74]
MTAETAHCQSKAAMLMTPVNRPFDATLEIPGSKSYTIRALLLAALTASQTGETITLKNPLLSDDTEAAMACLKTLGLALNITYSDSETAPRCATAISVSGNVFSPANANRTLHMNTRLSAATLRFFLALATVIPGQKILQGLPGLNKRPVKDLVEALTALGAEITYLEKPGYPPVQITSSALSADKMTVSGRISSQYTSALLMIAPLINPLESPNTPLTIQLSEPPVSQPYLRMTTTVMASFGVPVAASDHALTRFEIARPSNYNLGPTNNTFTIEPDASSMAYPLAIAALTRSKISIPNLNPQSAQADMAIIAILENQMGATVTWTSDTQNSAQQTLTLTGHGVSPVDLDMRDCPDQAQTIAVLAAFASGTSQLHGLQSLRVKETDRLAALEAELSKLGVAVCIRENTLVIDGGLLEKKLPKNVSIATYGDHRMAMAFAIAGAVIPGLIIEDPDVVNKTYPTYWQALQSLGIHVQAIPEPTSVGSVL